MVQSILSFRPKNRSEMQLHERRSFFSKERLKALFGVPKVKVDFFNTEEK